MALSPTARSLQALRKDGALPAVVEKWVARRGKPCPRCKSTEIPGGVRQDLYGILDLVALTPGIPGLLGIQATTGANLRSRVTKVLDSEYLIPWLEAWNRLEVWGWRKVKLKRGGKAIRWRVRRIQIELVDGAPRITELP